MGISMMAIKTGNSIQIIFRILRLSEYFHSPFSSLAVLVVISMVFKAINIKDNYKNGVGKGLFYNFISITIFEVKLFCYICSPIHKKIEL